MKLLKYILLFSFLPFLTKAQEGAANSPVFGHDLQFFCMATPSGFTGSSPEWTGTLNAETNLSGIASFTLSNIDTGDIFVDGNKGMYEIIGIPTPGTNPVVNVRILNDPFLLGVKVAPNGKGGVIRPTPNGGFLVPPVSDGGAAGGLTFTQLSLIMNYNQVRLDSASVSYGSGGSSDKLTNGGDAGIVVAGSNDNQLRLESNGTVGLYMDTNQRIGQRVSTPSAELHMVGAADNAPLVIAGKTFDNTAVGNQNSLDVNTVFDPVSTSLTEFLAHDFSLTMPGSSDMGGGVRNLVANYSVTGSGDVAKAVTGQFDMSFSGAADTPETLNLLANATFSGSGRSTLSDGLKLTASGAIDWYRGLVIGTSQNGTNLETPKLVTALYADNLEADSLAYFIYQNGSNDLNYFAGNVGIGRTQPVEKLDVDGNFRLSGAFMPGGDAGTPGYRLVSQGPGLAPTWQATTSGVTGSGSLNNLPKWTPDGTSLGDSQLSDNGTSVGINETMPSAKLHVEQNDIGNSGRPGLIVSATNAETNFTSNKAHLRLINESGTDNTFSKLEFADSETGNPAAMIGTVFNNVASDYGEMSFYTRSAAGFTEKLRMSDFLLTEGSNYAAGGGNLSVRTKDALAADMGGSIVLGGVHRSDGQKADFAKIKAGKVNATHGNTLSYLSFFTNPNGALAERMRIDEDGDVGIGETAPDRKLHVKDSNTVGGTAKFEVEGTGTGGVAATLFFNDTSGANDDDEVRLNFTLKDNLGNETVYATLVGVSGNVANGSENGALVFKIAKSAAISEVLSMSSVSTNFTIPDNVANSFRLQEGVNTYFNVETTDAQPVVSVNNGLADIDFTIGTSSTVDAFKVNAGADQIEVNEPLVIIDVIKLGSTGNVIIAKGTGSPEGSLAADVGSTYHRTDGGAGTSFYVKESGTGNTGWAAK